MQGLRQPLSIARGSATGNDPLYHSITSARTAAAGENSGSFRPKGMWSVDLLSGPRFYSLGVLFDERIEI